MTPRSAENTLHKLAAGYPVLAITGPRQYGKTTLARAMFSALPYVSLENPAQRQFAQDDPQGFLNQYADGAVIDEVQRCPDLFAWLQGIVDQQPRPGRFVLTGSQQFGLLSGITQSLAGRVALLSLLPFTSAELMQVQHRSDVDVVEWRSLGSPKPPIETGKTVSRLRAERGLE
jgi:predicted AAA+ superfamily ATPase